MSCSKREDFYNHDDLKNGLLQKSTQPWVQHVLTSIKEWNEDKNIYFFHAVFRVTKGGKSTYYDYIGHNCPDDENNQKFLKYLNATLNYFCEHGTTINTPLPNGRKKAGVAHIVVEEDPNICCEKNTSIQANDIKRIQHTKFDYTNTIIAKRSNEPGNYISGCLKVTLKTNCEEKCGCCGLKYLSVSSGFLKLNDNNDNSVNAYGEKGYVDQKKEKQTIIQDKNYYGFGASIFYVTDNTREVSEEYIKDVMAILNVEILKDFVKMHEELKSIKESIDEKNKALETFLGDLTQGAEGLVQKIKETKLYLNDDARNFIDLVTSDGFRQIFEGNKHIYNGNNQTNQEGKLNELFKPNQTLWQCQKLQKEGFWNGKLGKNSFEAVKGLRDLSGESPELPVDSVLWLFLETPECSDTMGSKTADRKIACHTSQAEMFVKGVMLLADQPEEELRYTIEKEDLTTVITFSPKNDGDLETLYDMVTNESDHANEGYHLNTFILRSLVAKKDENQIGEITYNNDNDNPTIKITYNFQGGNQ